MAKNSKSNQCDENTQKIVINIPCQLALRAEKYAEQTGNTLTGVVIEALDALLMKALKKG